MLRLPSVHPVPGLPGARFSLVRLQQPLELGLLHPEEQRHFRTLSTDARRREWWGGRVAARSVLHTMGVGDSWVESDPRGVPTVRGADVGTHLVSISHGRRWSVAMVMPSREAVGGVGVDVVEPEDLVRLRRIERRVWTDDERARFADEGLALGVAWGAKEALAKATATGMWAFAMRHVSLVALEPERGLVEVSLPGAQLSMHRLEDETLLVFAAASPALVERARAVAAPT